MTKVTQTVRQLWSLPHLRTTKKERHATWLELFYDLVFVVAVAELGKALAHDVSLSGLAKFIGLFIPVWYAWFHHTIYADRFDTDSFAHRFLTIIQMLGVAGIAANVHGAFGETSQAFAASFVIVKLVMIVLYRRCYHIEVAFPLAKRLLSIFSVSGSLWLVSIFVPAPLRFWLWGVTVVFEFLVVFHRSTRVKYAVMPVSESHVVERFGLFTIIVLGESVAGIVSGLTEVTFQLETTAIGVLGVLLVFGYWWIYFENLDGSALKGLGGWIPVFWLYVHLPLVMSLTVLGISIEHLVSEGASQKLDPSTIALTVGAFSVSLFAIGVTHVAVSAKKPDTLNPQKGRWRFISAFIVILFGLLIYSIKGTGLLLMGLLSVVSLGQVLGELFLLNEGSVHGADEIQDL